MQPESEKRAAVLAVLSVVSVYFQMVLGGLVRHSGAALACTDLPLCRGAVAVSLFAVRAGLARTCGMASRSSSPSGAST